ncbi:hypothetical protein Tco_0699255 [Tanacetum coccineum]
MERKIDEWEKSQNISLEQTDRTEPHPPPQAHTEQVNVVFTRSEKSDDFSKTQKDPPPPIIVKIEKDKPIIASKRDYPLVQIWDLVTHGQNGTATHSHIYVAKATYEFGTRDKYNLTYPFPPKSKSHPSPKYKPSSGVAAHLRHPLHKSSSNVGHSCEAEWNDTKKHGLIVASKDEVDLEHNMPKAMTSRIHLSNTWEDINLLDDMLQGVADSSKKLQPTLTSHFDPCSFSPTKTSQSFNHLANGNDMSRNKRFKITYIITGKVHYGDDEEEKAKQEEFYDYSSRGRLEEQVKQHNKKREASASEGKGPKDDDDESYEVNLDENFLTALGYRMPPALGMTLLSELSNEVGFPVTNTSFDALLESLLSTAKPFPQFVGYLILAS